MAQAGFTPIITYHSTTGAAVPTAGNLAPGEMALNIADMKLYAENSSGVVTLLASSAGASGDVVGPASATDNAITRFDGTTGKLVQNSGVTIDDSNNVSGVAQLNATTADLTNIEVTNIKAKDGTAAGSIADATGVVTLGSSVLTTTDINGGTIDNTVIGGSTAAAGSFTTLAASSSVTLSGGTANGVLYLNGSKVATSGSALTFDGTNLNLKNDGYLVFASPDATVEEKSRIQWLIEDASEMNSIRVNRVNAFGESSMGFYTRGGGPSALRYSIGVDGTSVWNVGGSEQMRLTSTGLGIGTSSPGYKLDVNGIINGNNSIISRRASGSQPEFVLTQTGVASWSIYNPPSSTDLRFYNGSDLLTLTSSGNLGLGVTPSAWGSGYVGLQLGTGLSLMGSSVNGNFASNCYFDGTNWKYIQNTYANNFYANFANNGSFVWATAPSGTAGNAITFTQAMTLDASGNLLVGTTSVAYGAAGRGLVEVNGSSNALIAVKTSDTARGYFAASTSITELAAVGASQPLVFTVNSAERARIDSSGNLIQTVNTTAATLATNNTLTFSIVDNSTLRISVRGSDGTTRTATVALT